MKKRLLSLLVVMVIVTLVIISPLNRSMTVQAGTPFMKTLDVKWDLKEGGWVTIRTNYAGNIWIDSRVKVKNFTIKDANKEGYKKLSCTIFFEGPKPTSEQFKKMIHSKFTDKHNGEMYGYAYAVFLYDYKTGDDLREDDNDYDVNIKDKWINGKTVTRIKDSHGCYCDVCSQKYKFTITYPEDYTGLCIGIAGNGSYKYPSVTDKALWKSPVYKKDKENIHFMRVK